MALSMKLPTPNRFSTELLRTRFFRSVKGHLHIWSFLLAISFCGLVFGSIVAGELGPGDSVILANSVEHLFISIRQHQLASGPNLLWQRLIDDGQVLALIWLFGLSVIGVPFVVITLFLRSFSIGFAVGFTVLQFGWKGFVVAGIGIFIHQIIAMTTLFIAASTAIRFSTEILQRTFPVQTLSVRFLKYTGLFVSCMAGLFVADVIQVYLAPHLLTFLLN